MDKAISRARTTGKSMFNTAQLTNRDRRAEAAGAIERMVRDLAGPAQNLFNKEKQHDH